MQKAIEALFDRYEREFNTAIAGHADLALIADQYTDSFIAASPAGVMVGKNDDELKKAMAAGFENYRKIGTRQMKLRGIRVQAIDDLHAVATVDWTASYDVKGRTIEIDFSNTYLVRVEGGTAKVFGWITGDEQAELKKHGVID